MNVQRFTARTSREALAAVRETFGDDAVVLSSKPCAEGVEVLAMAPEGLQHIEHLSQTAPKAAMPQAPVATAKMLNRPAAKAQPAPAQQEEVHADVERLSMSTLSFQDYVRERMLRRRQAALQKERAAMESRFDEPEMDDAPMAAAPAPAPMPAPRPVAPPARPAARPVAPAAPVRAAAPQRHDPPMLRDEIRITQDVMTLADAPVAAAPQLAAQRREQQDMMNELRSMKGMIEERFGALAFMEKLQRQPAQARLAQKLLDAGFSPALIRKLGEGMGADITDEMAWVTHVLERNLHTGEHEAAIEDQGGVYALIGSTGVGKTTSTAKIAAAFATKHGAANLGLITLDAYRVAAHEQLRAYGRILGVPVHTAHDRVTLEDLLDLLSAKKMVLIDTGGISQRDARTRELLEMLAHPSINKLLVVNASAQGETIEDVMLAYRASQAVGVVLSKVDEAMKLGPAVDALIRHRLKVVGVANGQRVPEDWHRLSSQALVARALRSGGSAAYRVDSEDVSLVFTAMRRPEAAAAGLNA